MSHIQVSQPETPSVDVENMGFMKQAVEDRRRRHLVLGKDLNPVLNETKRLHVSCSA